jgi:prevent-host-death family protein
MERIGIRELRQHASRFVQRAHAGETITVTDRGMPVARLTPLSPLEQHLSDRLSAHGLIPPTRPRRPFGELVRAPGPALSTALDDDRAERLA